MNTQTKSKSGFTIIEVVLVLAIAGLIFLIVFLAVPALQRSQRDQARKSDMGRLVAAVQDYRGNHQGNLPLPANEAALISQIEKDTTFEDPSGGDYDLKDLDNFGDTNGTYQDGTIIYQVGKKCDPASNRPTGAGGARNIAFSMKLESGDLYCQSN